MKRYALGDEYGKKCGPISISHKTAWGCAIGVISFFAVLSACGAEVNKAAVPTNTRPAPIVRGEKIGDLITPLSPSNSSATNVTNSTGQTVRATNAVPEPEEFITVAGEKYLRVSFARLASFPFKSIKEANVDSPFAPDDGRPLPNTVRILNEKRVALTGFVLPIIVTNAMATKFLLLQSRAMCCYGTIPRLNEWVIVDVPGKGISPVMDIPMLALGTLHVGEIRDNGRLMGIYQLDLVKLTKAQD